MERVCLPRRSCNTISISTNERGRGEQFFGHVEFAGFVDLDALFGFVAWVLGACLNCFDLTKGVSIAKSSRCYQTYYIHAFENTAKDCIQSARSPTEWEGHTDVTTVQPASFDGANEELTSVSVLAGVGHCTSKHRISRQS